MKHILIYVVAAVFLFVGTTSYGQSARKHTRRKNTMMIRDTSMSNMSNENIPSNGMSESENLERSAGDPNYLNHPYFNGEPRWTDVDSLYKHGDFPWAYMKDHPDNFRFDAASGNWQTNTNNLGTMKHTR
jgi:hypothetical protein